MKFRINRDHFSAGLSQVLNVVGSKATAPILNNVLVETTGPDRIALTTTNLDIGIRVSIRAQVGEAGALTLPVKRLATIVRELSDVEVMVDTLANQQVQIHSGRSKFKIVGIGKEEFPPIPDFSEDRSVSLDQATLGEMLRAVAYAQSLDETRYILNGTYFHFTDKKLTLVATDGRRLASISRELEHGLEKGGSFVLPARTGIELLRLLDKGKRLQIAFNDRRVAFQIDADGEGTGFVDKLHLVSKVVEGNYPNYQQVIPKNAEHRVKLERELLAQCVHRAALVTSDKSSNIRVRFSPNTLEIMAQSPEYGEAHETMAAEYSGPEVEMAYNPGYFSDPLKALTKDEVFFEFKDTASPGVFKTLDSFICVVMPVRLP
jgi:DNA polymerase-3 subunit beta